MGAVRNLDDYRPSGMQNSNGFVLLHQGIDNQPWSDDPFCMLVAQYLIRKVAYKAHTREYGKNSIDLDVGEFVTSHLNLAKASTVYGLFNKSKNPNEASKSAVKRVVKILEQDNFLKTRTIGKGKDACTVFTLKNWAKFQAKNASVLKPLNEPLEKPLETHTQQGLEKNSKPLTEPMPSPNNNKGSKQQVREVSKDTCPEPAASGQHEDIFLKLPLNKNGTFYDVTKTEVASKQEIYLAVDVRQEYRAMLDWLNSNPTRRKTSAGIKGFVTRWLGKRQNNPSLQKPAQKSTADALGDWS